MASLAFERIVEVRQSWCKWFWMGICFCEPLPVFLVGKRLGFSWPILRFLMFGYGLLVMRLILNSVADNFVEKLNDLPDKVPDSEHATLPKTGHRLFFQPEVEVEEEMLRFAVHEGDFIDPSDKEKQVIQMANGLLLSFGFFVCLSGVWACQRVQLRLRYDRMRGVDNFWLSAFLGLCLAKCSIPQMAVYFEEHPNDCLLETV